MTRAELLQAHVEAVEGRPVIWGESDCTSWCAGWVKAVTGKAAPLMAYSTMDEAHALIDEAGGLDVLWTRALGQVGIYSTPFEPTFGDVGLIRMSWGMSGCVFGHEGIAFIRGDDGTGLLRPRARYRIKVWSLPGSE